LANEGTWGGWRRPAEAFGSPLVYGSNYFIAFAFVEKNHCHVHSAL